MIRDGQRLAVLIVKVSDVETSVDPQVNTPIDPFLPSPKPPQGTPRRTSLGHVHIQINSKAFGKPESHDMKFQTTHSEMFDLSLAGQEWH